MAVTATHFKNCTCSLVANVKSASVDENFDILDDGSDNDTKADVIARQGQSIGFVIESRDLDDCRTAIGLTQSTDFTITLYDAHGNTNATVTIGGALFTEFSDNGAWGELRTYRVAGRADSYTVADVAG